jgi:hypothetical protein
MRRFLYLVVLLPLAIVIVIVSVANRTLTTFSLDPFNMEAPAWSLTAPLFVLLFLTLAMGVVLGGIAAWIGQGKWRRAARAERHNAAQLRREVEGLRDRLAAATPALPAPPGDRNAA